ncbi:hypothetical protein [Streptomyces sp. NPDC058157]|uniref:hypothetical protein n=1 Tax=Streptomyces sp. NPDC058157 TaxID=3346360 RepID=UPI0036EFA374
MSERRTDQDKARRRDLADAAAGWPPKRGDLARDTTRGVIALVIGLPEDTRTAFHELCPEGGGESWTAHLDDLTPPDGHNEDSR